MLLKRERSKIDGSLFVTGRDVEEQDLALTYEAESGAWAIAGQAADFRRSDQRTEVLAVLEKAGGPLSPAQVAQSLGRDRNAVKQLMWRMAQDGELRSDGESLYIINNP